MDSADPPRRGRPRAGTATLSRDRILRAALDLVDREGVAAVSMRKVATALGVDPMSLYNHVANKDALLDGIAEVLLSTIPTPPEGEPRVVLTALARGFRSAMLAHPRSAPLVLTRQVGSPAVLAPTEAVLAPLLAAGHPPERAVHALRTVLAFLVGTLLREVDASPDFSAPPDDRRRRTLESSGLPAVATAAPHLAVCDHEAEFEFGLRLLVDALVP